MENNTTKSKWEQRKWRRQEFCELYSKEKIREGGLCGSSGKVVLSAVAINGGNFLAKLALWALTGSHSMFAEAIHSLADTMNQVVLVYGVHKSAQAADEDHPYGYSNMQYVAALISGVGIFCVGTGLSVYHGIVGLTHPTPMESVHWALLGLAISALSEGVTFVLAVNSLRKKARNSNMGIFMYILESQDPSVNVVLIEDCAAMLSIAITTVCIGLSMVTENSVPDAVGSLMIGGLLGTVAWFIIVTNVTSLIGRSISRDLLEKFNYEIRSDPMIRGIYDVKGINLGNSWIRYKAELDVDGKELTRVYLLHQDLLKLFEEVQNMTSTEELRTFLMIHGEKIADSLGPEIDRIEVKLRRKYLQIRHCDLEIL